MSAPVHLPNHFDGSSEVGVYGVQRRSYQIYFENVLYVEGNDFL